MIEHYDFGEITINGKRYTSDVIIFKEKVYANWWRKEGHQLHPEDLKEVFSRKPAILVVGTGKAGIMKVLPKTEELLKQKQIKLIVDRTDRACHIFNQLSPKEDVVAALHLTC